MVKAMATRDDGGKNVSGDGTVMERDVRGEGGTVATGTATVVMALWRLRGKLQRQVTTIVVDSAVS